MQKYTEFIDKIEEKHEIINFTEGKKIKGGRASGGIRNPYWLVKNKETNEEYYIMVCGDRTFTYISKEDIKKVIESKYAWTYNITLGYIQSNIGYLHSFIMDHIGHGKGYDSVDHINRKRLDNRRQNLRIVPPGENTSNQSKKDKNREACTLPIELGERKEPKYVQYRPENYSIQILKKRDEYAHMTDEQLLQLKILKRDYFIVKNNPKQIPDEKGKRYWVTTKSMKVSIVEKYDMMIKYLESIGYDWKLDMIDVRDLHLEFFTKMEDDDFVKIKKPTKAMKENIEQNAKERAIKIGPKKFIEILLWKEKLKNGEKMDDGSKINKYNICKYYKEKDDINLSDGKIHRIWNIKVLKEEHFKDNNLEISYEKYLELINFKLKKR